ncbi:LIM and senescent cell antigen-like-containing domain protein 2 [Tupaia chinensis]|uniref:LIM and senescent cell antigen-like-containing domain protein 2 n=1 Tax=Tupaia chinensis TaxID=246437 RepID=L9KM38_TUPCH|nr:LIM and senescent cell antigen-like-containing domain protein 2 [Tupaia chinensis]
MKGPLPPADHWPQTPPRSGLGLGWPYLHVAGAAQTEHLCRPCHNREKAKGLGKYICQRCHLVIDEQPLMFRSDAYHPDHFSCTHCGQAMASAGLPHIPLLILFLAFGGFPGQEATMELVCLGALWTQLAEWAMYAAHVDMELHFVCAKCEKPFLGHRHYEKKGLAYCETHYNQLFGDVCYNCSHVIEGDVVSALNKAWCVSCFSCSTCNSKLTLKNKFVEFDMKPVCKRCYEKFPLELKKRLKKLSELTSRKAQPKSVDLNSA